MYLGGIMADFSLTVQHVLSQTCSITQNTTYNLHFFKTFSVWVTLLVVIPDIKKTCLFDKYFGLWIRSILFEDCTVLQNCKRETRKERYSYRVGD